MEIIFLLDNSSSMRYNKIYYTDCFNSFIDKQIIENPTSLITLIKFNQDIQVCCNSVDIGLIPKLTPDYYTPMGTTALYDAIGTGVDIKCQDKENISKNVVMVILTDGLENTSKYYTKKQVIERVDKMSELGWHFVYIGCGDFVSTGKDLHISTCVRYQESYSSISRIPEVCNMVVDNAKNDWRANSDPDQKIPEDISDISIDFCKMILK